MRLVSWNICHGGGRRASQIIAQLRDWRPDIVGLSEFRGTAPSLSIAAALTEMGLLYQHSTVDPKAPGRDGLLLASCRPFAVQQPNGIPDSNRWIHGTLQDEVPLSLILLWVPNRDKTGIKYAFHDATVESLRLLASGVGLSFGDTNTGVPEIDEEARYFNQREGQWYSNLANAGWVDLWRHRNPNRREYTWHNYASGAGFRLDQVFATNLAQESVRDVRYDWGNPPVGAFRGPSDHAAIVVDMCDRTTGTDQSEVPL